MKTSLELRQKRAALVAEGRSIITLCETEKRDMNGDETTKYEKIMADVDANKAEIDRLERQETLETEMRSSTGIISAGAASAESAGDPAVKKDADYARAFKNWLMRGFAGCTEPEKKLLSEKRALSVGTTTAGGYTVPQGFYDQLTDAVKWYGGIRASKATNLRTSTGNALPMPTSNDTSITGALLSENTADTTADITFGQAILNAYKFTSNTILVSLELMQDSAFDLESFIAMKLGQRIGRSQNTYFTTGTGTSQPQGVVTASTLGKTGLAGQTTSFIYADLVDLEHSVDPAYRQGAQFMFHDSTLKAAKKILDGYGRPLWLPGITEKAPDTILGYDYVINNDMPVMGVSAKSILFGDFSNFYVRDVMDTSVFKIEEKYIEAGQVGFVAFARADSKLLDAGMHPISCYANSAT